MSLILFFFFCFITIVPITILLHELGHLFLARLCQVKNINVTIGRGRECFSFKISSMIFFIKLFPLTGLTTYQLEEANEQKKQLIISLGGPLLNGFVAFFLLFPGLGTGSHLITIWFQWLALYNLWMCVMNLIPFRWGNYFSDGWVILKIVENKREDQKKFFKN